MSIFTYIKVKNMPVCIYMNIYDGKMLIFIGESHSLLQNLGGVTSGEQTAAEYPVIKQDILYERYFHYK